MLDAAGDGKSGVDRARVGRSVGGRVAEEKSGSGSAAELDAGRGEHRLAALIILVQMRNVITRCCDGATPGTTNAELVSPRAAAR
jgi:hypothetical protein